MTNPNIFTQNVMSTDQLCFIDKADDNFEYLKNETETLNFAFETINNVLENLQEMSIATIIAFTSSTVPTGFLECDGSAISRNVYSGLFAIIGTAYGIGNGSTTFNIPDLRGKFIRGWDNGAGIDIGRVFGSSQEDSIITHTHTYSDIYPISQGGYAAPGADSGGGCPTNTATKTDTTSDSGSNSCPINIALMYIIKY